MFSSIPNATPDPKAEAQAPTKLETLLADLPPIELEQLKYDFEVTREAIDDALQALLIRVRPSLVRAFIDKFQGIFTPMLTGSPADDPFPISLGILRTRAGHGQACDEPFDTMRSAVDAIHQHYRVNLGREPSFRDIHDMVDRVMEPNNLPRRRRGRTVRRRRRGDA